MVIEECLPVEAGLKAEKDLNFMITKFIRLLKPLRLAAHISSIHDV